jgi:hypothetical protein
MCAESKVKLLNEGIVKGLMLLVAELDNGNGWSNIVGFLVLVGFDDARERKARSLWAVDILEEPKGCQERVIEADRLEVYPITAELGEAGKRFS